MTDQQPAWMRLLTEDEQAETLEGYVECVRDDPRIYAELYLDSMSEEEIARDHLSAILPNDPTDAQVAEWLRERKARL